MNSINLYNRLDDVFMNSKNSKTSDPHRLLIKKIDLKRSDNHAALSNHSIY